MVIFAEYSKTFNANKQFLTFFKFGIIALVPLFKIVFNSLLKLYLLIHFLSKIFFKKFKHFLIGKDILNNLIYLLYKNLLL